MEILSLHFAILYIEEMQVCFPIKMFLRFISCSSVKQIIFSIFESFCLDNLNTTLLLLCEISKYFSDQENIFSRKQYRIRESQYYYVNIMWKQFLQNFVAITVVIILELELCYLQFSFIYSIAYLFIFYVSKNRKNLYKKNKMAQSKPFLFLLWFYLSNKFLIYEISYVSHITKYYFIWNTDILEYNNIHKYIVIAISKLYTLSRIYTLCETFS